MTEALQLNKIASPNALARNRATIADQLRELRTVYDPELDRLLARHSNAPADLLEKLSHSSDRVTRRHVVRHPSAAKEVLLRLAPQFPMDFLLNPVVDWLLIEEPDLLQNLGKRLLINVLKRRDCPQALMQWAARNATFEEQLALAMNPAATAEVIATLATIDGPVGLAARCHFRYPAPPSLSPSQLFVDEIKKGLSTLDESTAVSYWTRGRRKLPPRQELRAKTDSSNPVQPLFIDPNVKMDVHHPGRTPGLLGPAQWLWLSPEGRAAVLGMPFPLAQGELPAGNGAMKLAKSQSTPVEILAALAQHHDQYVRIAVAENPQAPQQLLEVLSKDSNWYVRRAATDNLGNPTLTHEAKINASAATQRPGVSHRKTETGDAGHLADRPSLLQRWLSVAKDPSSAPELLAKLARRKNTALHWMLVTNSNTPPNIRDDLLFKLIMKLGFDAIPETARSAAEALRERVCCAIDAQRWWHKIKLLADHHGYARLPSLRYDEIVEQFKKEIRSFADDPASTLSAEIMGVRQKGIFYVHSKHVMRGLKDKSGYVQDEESASYRLIGIPRLLSLAHPNALATDMLKACHSVAWPERMAVARNPNAPSKLLTTLKKDANRFVAQQAADTERLKQELQQWQVSAIRVLDRWQFQVATLGEAGIVAEGFPSETAELIVSVRRYREHLEPLASEIQFDVSQSRPERVNEEILKAFNNKADELIAMLPQYNQWLDIFRRELTPAQWQDFWVLMSSHPLGSVRAWLASRQECPDEIINKLATDPSSEVLIEIARNSPAIRNANPEVLNALRSAKPQALQKIALHATDITLIEILADHSEANIRRAIAANSSISPAILEKLAKDTESQVRRAIAEHSKIDEKTLSELASDPSPDIRSSVAARSTAPAHTLVLLSKDTNWEVRRAVAGNSSTPATVLRALSEDLDSRIREVVVANPSTAPDLLGTLANDPEERVRRAWLSNVNIDVTAFLQRAAKATWFEEKIIIDNPVLQSSELGVALKDSWQSMSKSALELFTRNPFAPADMLKKLATDWLPSRRTVVASSPAVPKSLLLQLASDDDRKVREAVANNPAADAEMLRLLSKDQEKEVRQATARHPNTPPDALEILAQGSTTRLDVARHPNTRPEQVQALLAALAKDPQPVVRLEVIWHTAVDTALLAHLVDDHDRDVRAAAKLFLALRALPPDVEGDPKGVVVAQALRQVMEQRAAFTATPPGLTMEADVHRLRQALASLDLLPKSPSRKALGEAVRSSDWLTRFAVALHEKATDAHRKVLVQDTIPEVAAAAQLMLDAPASAASAAC